MPAHFRHMRPNGDGRHICRRHRVGSPAPEHRRAANSVGSRRAAVRRSPSGAFGAPAWLLRCHRSRIGTSHAEPKRIQKPFPDAPISRPAADCGAGRDTRFERMPCRCDAPTRIHVLELMVTMAIVAMLAAVAAPGMIDFIRANRMSTTARQLDADIVAGAARGDQAQLARAGLPGRQRREQCGSGTAAVGAGMARLLRREPGRRLRRHRRRQPESDPQARGGRRRR